MEQNTEIWLCTCRVVFTLTSSQLYALQPGCTRLRRSAYDCIELRACYKGEHCVQTSKRAQHGLLCLEWCWIETRGVLWKTGVSGELEDA